MSVTLTATTALRDEHQLILRALDLLDTAAERIAAGEAVPEAAWSALLDWLAAFADARHHAKEEVLLFPALAAAGVPREGGPIGMMLEEHDLGRALVRDMRAGPSAQRAVAAREYSRLLRGHIAKEDDVLFDLADALLDEAAVQVLCCGYAAADLAQGAATEPAAARAALAALASGLEVPARAR